MSSDLYRIAEWESFLSVQAGAAATLTGLVFVAVSLNLSKIMSFPGLTARAAESLLQLLQVFFVSSAALIPGQPANLLGLELLLIGAISWAAQVIVQVRCLKPGSGWSWRWLTYRAVLTQLACLPFCIAGILLLLGRHGALYWLVPGFAFSFVAGVLSAWVLLIEILR